VPGRTAEVTSEEQNCVKSFRVLIKKNDGTLLDIVNDT